MVQIVHHQKTNGYSFQNPETGRFYPLSICGYWAGRYDVWHRFPTHSTKAGTFENLGDAVAWVMQAIDHL